MPGRPLFGPLGGESFMVASAAGDAKGGTRAIYGVVKKKNGLPQTINHRIDRWILFFFILA
jgi:hypothetical protein